MAEVEEPQFTSLAQRIAALNKSQAEHRPAPSPTAKPPSLNRPTIDSRSRTVNNPPVSSQIPPAAKIDDGNRGTNGVRQNGILPPPPVDRDQLHPPPPQPPSNKPKPPPLPARKATQNSPSLPPRRPSSQLNRKASNSSIQSYSSTISGMSLGHTVSSNTSVSSKDGPRNLPPTFDQAKLPPLPPTRRELEEKAKLEKASARPTAKAPLESTKSAPNVLRPPVIEREAKPAPPKLPSRPSLPPRTSTGQQTGNSNAADASATSQQQPSRKLPPPVSATQARSALTMGFGSGKAKPEIKAPSPRPAQAHVPVSVSVPVPVPAKFPVKIPVKVPVNVPLPIPVPVPVPVPGAATHKAGGNVMELDASNFDAVVMSGKPALVDCYAPFCKYCKELDPIYEELADHFAHAKDQVTITRIDSYTHKAIGERFDVQGWPTIFFFDGHSDTPELYQNYRNLEYFIKFIEEKTGVQSRAPETSSSTASNGAVPPPIPVSSRPTMSQVDNVKSRPAPAPAAVESGCLLCRDFSGPDSVAAQYPRESLPRGDATAYLAEVLCGPFPSATDKQEPFSLGCTTTSLMTRVRSLVEMFAMWIPETQLHLGSLFVVDMLDYMSTLHKRPDWSA